MGDSFVSFNDQDLQNIWHGCISSCDGFLRSFLVEAKPVSFDNCCLQVEAAPFLIGRFAADPKRQEMLNVSIVRHTGIPNATVRLVPQQDNKTVSEQQTSVFPPVPLTVARAGNSQPAVQSVLDQFQPSANPSAPVAPAPAQPEVPTNSAAPASSAHNIDQVSVGSSGYAYDYSETMLQQQMTFDTYVCGENNQLAVYTARAVAEQPGASLSLNPLFFYGGVGLGKTHLMNAIGNYIVSRFPEKRVYYISAEQFMNEYIKQIGQKKMDDFYQKYRNSIDTLLIDDIQFLEDKEKTQEEFFHTFEYLRNNHKQIVIASDRPVELLPKMTPRLQSRLQQGMVADIQAPKLETRIAILKQKAQQGNFTISDDVLYFIADSNHANVRELEGALTRVWTSCSLMGKPVTLENAKEALKVDIQANDTPDPEAIIKAVSAYFNISEELLIGNKRNSNIVKPRHIAMYLMRKYTSLSLEAIGKIFDRNHTTVLHACNYVESNIKDTLVKNSLINLRDELKLRN